VMKSLEARNVDVYRSGGYIQVVSQWPGSDLPEV
jgi:hypothetical protein